MRRTCLYTGLAVAIIAAVMLTACGPSPTPAAPPPEATKAPEPTAVPTEAPTEAPTAAPTAKTATITFFEEPDSLNPYYTDMWFAANAIDLFLVGLWRFDDQVQPNLEMAAEFPTVENGGLSEDGLTLTYKLRPEAKWSDGEPVTAHDFVFTYDMITDEANTVITSYPYDTYIDSMTALDDHTLQIVMTEPFVAWPTGFFSLLHILPKHILEPVYEAEGTIDNAEWNRNPTVSNGPFILKEWKAASHLIFEANPNYWRGRPKLDQIFIRIVPDTEAQMAAIQAGDTDIGVFLSAADKPDIDALGNVEMVSVPSGYMESWFFNLDPNTNHPAMRDVQVRKAIVMAVDRQKIIDELFYGLYEIPKTYWYDNATYDDPTLEPIPYDPEEAKALLDEAGWVDTNGDDVRDKDGEELVLRYSTTAGNELREATQVVVQQMLAEVGVKADIVNYSYDTIWNSYGDDGPIATGQYDIAQWSDGAYDYPDPNTPYFLCDQFPSDESPDGLNWYGCIPELDELFQKQAVTADVKERAAIFHEIARIMRDEVIWIGLRTDPDLWSLNTRLKDVRLSGADPFWNAFEWDVGQ
jgi:peptide/nickel transport system substrate-binding protein